MKKSTFFRNWVAKTKHRLVGFVAILASVNSYAQTNPTATLPPVSENFGTATFTSLAANFGSWTSGSSPSGTQANAEGSTASGDATISTATTAQSTAGCYGYSTSSNGRFYIQTSSNGTNGTNQLAAALNTTNYGSIAVSYDIEMISANPRTIGVELQYRVGTAGSWTNVSGTVYSHTSSDRSNGNVDNFSITLPAGAENNAVVQLRWVTWRGSQAGNSSGIAIDNISITATSIQAYYYRSKQSGNWNSISTWEASPDNSTWANAIIAPKYTANTITIQSSDSVSFTATDTIDQVVVDGVLKYEDVVGVTPVINNGTGTDLVINGKFYDAGPNSITWLSSATWSMGSNGYLIRNRSTSATNWRDKYNGGISTIPATAYWIVRKNSGDSPLLSSTGGMYYPNLKIENYTGSGWTTGTNSSFTGSSNTPVVKGNLFIGGNGSNTVSFLNNNTHANPVLVNGSLTLKSACTLRSQGTGFEIQGDLALNGTVDYTGGGASVMKLSGNANQNLSGTLNFNNLELDKTATAATVTLQSSATISGGLSFVKGYLISSSTNLLTFKHHASAGNAGGPNTNDSSYVRGPVKKIGNSAFTFPVGKGTNYQYIRISAPTDSTDAFTAEYFDSGQTLGTATDPTFDYVSSCEYFVLDRTTGTSTVSITLAVDMSSCVTNLFPDPRVIGWDGSKWADLGQGSFTFTTFSGTIVSDGPLSNYGAITLGNNSNSIALPPDTAHIPSSFRYIKNNGQLIAINDSLRPDIKYYMNDVYPQAYLGSDTLHYVFAHIDTVTATTDTMVRVDVTYMNANSTYPVAQKVDSTYTNYFLAHCPSGVVSVPQYQRLTYGKLYQHIDLVYAQSSTGIKFAFNMRAGAKADVIRAKYAGADSVQVLGGGELRIFTALGNLTFNAPNAFQVDSSGNTVPVSCDWYVDNDTEVIFTFPVGYNQHLPLGIVVEQGYAADPMHINNPEWSQYFGGNGYDEGTGVTTDTDGNPYFTGFTSSTNFPSINGYQMLYGGNFDAYIAKFGSANGASMGMVMNADKRLWTTYYGGTGEDKAFAISTSGNGTTGKVFVTGYTENGDFPTHNNAGIYNQSMSAGGKEAFIIKLDNQFGGTSLSNVWATHFGGSGDEIAKSIKNDGAGNFYIGGSTSSASYSTDNCIVPTDNNFPKCNTFSAFNNGGAFGGGTSDAFIAKFSNAGTLLWSSFYGGNGEDVVNGIAIDGNNTVYLTGKTASSSGFPLQTISGSDVYNQGTFGGGTDDAFVSKFNSSGTHLWSSYFGGSGDEQGVGIAVDANDYLYISGETSSSTPACTTCVCLVPATGQFPLCHAAGAYFQGTGNTGTYGGGTSDGFIAKFDSDCYLKWGTYYGGNGQDVINSLALDYEDQLFFVGTTLTSSPTTNIQSVGSSGGWYYNQSTLGGTKDCFLGFFDASNARYWSSYFGATTIDVGNSIAVYSTSATNEFWYITGATNSLVNQMAFNAFGNCCPNAYTQTNFNLPTSTEAYVARFSMTGMYMMGVENIIGNNQSIDALVYPNPASYNITLKFTLTERENVSIDVYSITGQLLYTEKLGKQQGEITKQIDFSTFQNGVYLLQLKTDTKTVTKKIIKHE